MIKIIHCAMLVMLEMAVVVIFGKWICQNQAFASEWIEVCNAFLEKLAVFSLAASKAALASAS